MPDEALSPEQFNSELRAWVKKVTGRADGGVGVSMSRSTFYRLTHGSNLMALEDLIRVVRGCAPRTLDVPERGAWTRKNIDIWQRKWWKAYASREEGEPPAEPPAPPEVGAASNGSRFSFPRARVTVLRGMDTGDTKIRLSEALDRWLEHSDSNLFFITGSSGAGKTVEVKDWADAHDQVTYLSLRDGQVDFDELVLSENASPTVIDDFDLVSSTAEEHGVTRPDLSELRSGLGRGGRFIVISKRNLQTVRDELAEQLRSPTRMEDLGVVSPVVVRVDPISSEELKALGDERDDDRMRNLATEMERVGGLMLATPMVLRQLYSTIQEGEPAPRTQWDAYTVYLRHVCGQPWDRKGSRIPSKVRFETYRDIAWDLFVGMDEPVPQTKDLIPVSRVSEWLFANLQRDLDITRKRDFLTYEWIADLLDHAEIFGVSRRGGDSVESAEFTHETFYQYFVAYGIRDRLRDGRGMALDGARFADMHMGPLVTSFLKSGFKPGDLDTVAALSVRESLSWMDRLICLYLTEERSDYAELLDRAPERYWDELEFVLEAFRSVFLRKAAIFQLLIKGRTPVDKYLDIMRREEDPQAIARERDVLGWGADITQALLARLHNPVLAPAIPITAYRLGQMGDISCVSHLEGLTGLSSDHQEVVAEAIRRVKERHG
ncbi:hypothetical protein J2S40_000934 [Nocardioides luteus]|uniref:Uncharacterized protein n=1 Tax=Nocardioides luteus TaxID=1844 RepID=A0ABQ5SWB4_9ACTN|nr:hypothetical protein [Nocardioides luteus]MDR7309876.1 hypothetical protein [Nocardioides luteus]GGR59884.1 hypothetical protein GCM10010197_28500 [Nocardioides luteus]GLJ67216.1 hypothetical protein GCM10017579_12520 [Nocardioides luteus]